MLVGNLSPRQPLRPAGATASEPLRPRRPRPERSRLQRTPTRPEGQRQSSSTETDVPEPLPEPRGAGRMRAAGSWKADTCIFTGQMAAPESSAVHRSHERARAGQQEQTRATMAAPFSFHEWEQTSEITTADTHVSRFYRPDSDGPGASRDQVTCLSMARSHLGGPRVAQEECSPLRRGIEVYSNLCPRVSQYAV